MLRSKIPRTQHARDANECVYKRERKREERERYACYVGRQYVNKEYLILDAYFFFGSTVFYESPRHEKEKNIERNCGANGEIILHVDRM